MSKRKVKEGVVLSNKMNKTLTVGVERTIPHQRYGKVVTRQKKYYAHCEEKVEEGKRVRMIETRPLSKLKRWAVLEVLDESTTNQDTR